ncbi:MAG: hypothetical protein GF311_01335 [Candidatus Lokiarchaeota archaeon]|nr:hypothetical protein [Candidatus Lokiarchaeota archaeon]
MASEDYIIIEDNVNQEIILSSKLSKKLKPKFTGDFLKKYEKYLHNNLYNEFRFPVKIRNKKNKKFNPFLRLAIPEESHIIAEIVKETYEGTYPYKEMEDPFEINRMIKSGKYKFIVFLDEESKIIGSTCFVINLKEKKGYLRSLVVRKEWIGKIDAKRAYITACLMVWNIYRNKILLWWAETRTADAKTQAITRECGLIPIAWFPNKDIFYNRIESDLMIIIYNKKRLEKYRSKRIPSIIPCVIRCYEYSKLNYHLENPKIVSTNLKINERYLKKLEKKLRISKNQDKYGYVRYRFLLKDSKSFFEFVYTPKVKNFEKTKFKVRNPTELFLFLSHCTNLAEKLDIRYIEAYISSYESKHQQIFFNFGFKPRGYIPAWNINPLTCLFEDYILFNKYKKNLSEMELTQESKDLITYIKD